MKTIVYIDGLNFYYGATKDTPYKWADLKGLSQTVLGDDKEIIQVKLFTARVKPTHNDPNVHHRQNAYLRALKSYIPEIEIFYGHFSEHVVNMLRAVPDGKNRFVDVVKREEKGSDVNLAVHFLNDAWLDRYECGVIISNDSDLAEAVKLVKDQTEKTIGIISPYKTVSKELAQHSHFQRTIREGALRINQMPNQIPGTKLTKPNEW